MYTYTCAIHIHICISTCLHIYLYMHAERPVAPRDVLLYQGLRPLSGQVKTWFGVNLVLAEYHQTHTQIADSKHVYNNHVWIWWYSAKTRFTPSRFSRRRPLPILEIHQRGVQWKQGVVICMLLYTSLLYNTTPIHCTHLPLHPPVMNTQIRLGVSGGPRSPSSRLGRDRPDDQNDRQPSHNMIDSAFRLRATAAGKT